MKNPGLILAVVLCGACLAPAQDRPRLFGKHRDCPPTPYAPADCPPGAPHQADPNRAPLDPSSPLNPNAATSPNNSAFSEALASAGEGGTQPSGSYMPSFFGDLLASTIVQGVFIPETLSGAIITSPNVSQSGAIKLVEGDSPRPMNRVYYNYNYFGNIEVNPLDPTAPTMTVNRHVIGVEKTLLDSRASIGLRLPFFSMGGQTIAYDTGFVGDLTLITKYALINNRENGNVLSTGVAFTLPSGGSPALSSGTGQRRYQDRYYPVTFQPYVGYILNPFSRLFIQGFHSVAVPTIAEEPTFMSNAIGTGFWLYRNSLDGIIQGIIPTMEVHVNTPFNHRTAAAIGDTLMQDSVNLTMGAHVVMPRSVLGGAVGVPLAYGPHRIEALATFTLRY